MQPVALTEAKMEQNGNGEPDLPDINAGGMYICTYMYMHVGAI